ncbi:hypothetical protein Moror_435 [Moniliophthora roreri MCA 2997]|uniref:Uncharacterized protein n=1 Tax=Moniliophthora roreri (strain MCA 2997) TaxID=1381753 RepID=V2Z2D9_MONRO|nr:hypothetical protein Moror_435 [Moniliophthora roreri MCA 2997]
MGDVCTKLGNVIETVDRNPVGVESASFIRLLIRTLCICIQRHFKWRTGNTDIRWDCRTMLDDGSPMCICYGSDTSKSQLATFVPPPILSSPPLPAAIFTVFPDGHEFFEHILISILVIQRILTHDA